LRCSRWDPRAWAPKSGSLSPADGSIQPAKRPAAAPQSEAGQRGAGPALPAGAGAFEIVMPCDQLGPAAHRPSPPGHGGPGAPLHRPLRARWRQRRWRSHRALSRLARWRPADSTPGSNRVLGARDLARGLACPLQPSSRPRQRRAALWTALSEDPVGSLRGASSARITPGTKAFRPCASMAPLPCCSLACKLDKAVAAAAFARAIPAGDATPRPIGWYFTQGQGAGVGAPQSWLVPPPTTSAPE